MLPQYTGRAHHVSSCHQSVPLAGAARCPSIPGNSDMHAIRQHAHGGPPRKPPKNSPKHRHTSTNPHSQRAAASPARRHLEDHLEENHEELQVVLNAPADDQPKTKSTREAETCSNERRTPAQEPWVARHGKAQPAVSATCISSSISKPQSLPRT